MNLILFLAGAIVLYGVMGLPSPASRRWASGDEPLRHGRARLHHHGRRREGVFIDRGDGYYTYWYAHELLTYAPYAGEFVKMLWGNVPYYLFEMLSYFVQISIVLAIFNLIPIRRWTATTCSTIWCCAAASIPRRARRRSAMW